MSVLGVELTSGALAGAAGILSTHPLDTIRIRLQSSSSSLGTNRRYTGTLDCFSKTMQTEGGRGLYKGVVARTVTFGFMNSALFLSYEFFSDVARRRSKRPASEELPLAEVVSAGVGAGLCASFINGPAELVKCMAQTNLLNKGTAAEEWAMFRSVVKTHGWFGGHGPARGLLMTIGRDAPSFGVYFGAYEAMTRSWGKDKVSSFFAGGCAGCLCWTVVYPIDVIKTRWSLARPGDYRSAWHCLCATVAREGWPVLLKGYGATMARAWPQSGVIFATYELVKGLLVGKR